MSRTFQDESFREWEAYASGGRHGFSENANIVFHCLTEPELRSRILRHGGDNGLAQAAVARVSDSELLDMLNSAQELP